MKPKFVLSTIFLSIAMTACNDEDSIVVKDPGITSRTPIYLFHEILLSVDSEGKYSFVDPVDTVRAQVEQVIIHDNQELAVIDEFGLDTTALGSQYFYATQYGEEGAVTVFVFLTVESGAISIGSPGVGGATAIRCVNERCCQKCIVMDPVDSEEYCACHQTMWSCIINSDTNIKCKKYQSYII